MTSTSGRELRVLMIEHPVDGGVPRHVADLAAGLDGCEVRMVVACPQESPTWRTLRSRPRVRLEAVAGGHTPRAVSPQALGLLRRLVREADVVHAHSSVAGAVARVVARTEGRADRCVFSPHGWSFWSVRGSRRRLFEAVERRAAGWTAAVIAVSDAERRAGLEAGVGHAEQFHVVPNGIDLNPFSGMRRAEGGPILWVGRLAPPKRPDLLIEAFASIHSRDPGARLTFVGDGPLRGAVQAAVDAAGLSASVALLGERDDVPELLGEARCLVLASDYESCPLSAIEAMAGGVPVVATRVGGTEEVVRDGVSGLLVPPDDADALAEALGVVWRNPAAAVRMGAAGRRIALARFSRDRMAADTLDVYRSVIAAATSPPCPR